MASLGPVVRSCAEDPVGVLRGAGSPQELVGEGRSVTSVL